MKNILILYYSQTGQLKNIVDSITKPWLNSNSFSVDFVEYKPVNPYPFPWSSDAFFDVFPESREGITCPMLEINIDESKHYDLIVFAYQVWYLSPSIPAWSILNSPQLSSFLKGKNVLTVLGVRNMWVQAHQRVQQKLKNLKAQTVGNIVLSDPANNLVSVITVIKWLINGNQGPSGVWPRSGVPQKRIEEAQKYGQIIQTAIENNKLEALQKQLVKAGAVDLDFVLKTIEANGFRIFGIWARLILKKGKAGNPKRLFRVRVFKYYLLFMIFGLAPIASLIFRIINLIFYPIIQNHLKNLKELNYLKMDKK